MGRACLAVVVAALVVVSVASAEQPLVLLLASAHGRGTVTIGASTAHLHGRVSLVVRTGGVGLVRGSASISCEERNGGSDEDFKFRIAPHARMELWRYAGPASTHCVITASVRGRGSTALALRGY